MSHFSNIGLAATDAQQFAALVDRMMPTAVDDLPDAAPGRHSRWTDASGATLAVHTDGKNAIECVTPYFVAPAPTRWRVRTTAPTADADCAHCGGADCDVLDESGEMLTRTAVQWLHYQPYRAWLGEPRDFALEVVAFAHRAGFYASATEFEADQESWWPGLDKSDKSKLRGFADVSFMPMGMFGSGNDVGARATSTFAGKVEAVSRLTNALTGAPFLHVRIATLPGAIDVVIDTHEGTPELGRQAVVSGWLVGRPDAPPPPRKTSFFGRIFGRH